MPDVGINAYVRRLDSPGRNAGVIHLTQLGSPDNWVTAGTWSASEPGGGKFFGEKSGSFQVQNGVAKLKGANEVVIELTGFAAAVTPAGGGTIFEDGLGGGPILIAWRTSRPWD